MRLHLVDPLIWPLVPPEHRASIFTLWSLNDRFAQIAQSGNEAALRQIKLIWWRDALDHVSKGSSAPSEPLLQAVEGARWPDDVKAAAVALADAWAVRVAGPLPHAIAQTGEQLFAITHALLAGGTSATGMVTTGGAIWALTTAAEIEPDSALRRELFAEAQVIAVPRQSMHRSLLALEYLARQIAIRHGQRSAAREQMLVLRVGLLGR